MNTIKKICMKCLNPNNYCYGCRKKLNKKRKKKTCNVCLEEYDSGFYSEHRQNHNLLSKRRFNNKYFGFDIILD